MNRKIYQIAFAGAILILLGIWYISGFKGINNYQSATVLDVPVPLPEFSLTGNNGKEVTLFNFRRKWTFMFFGYTHCPDVCPTALVDLNNIYDNLSQHGDLANTQFVFVSVDPERDTVDTLNGYITFFNKNFFGLTGDPGVIKSLSAPLGVSYWRAQGRDSENDYLIDHSASFLLIDPLGRMRAVFVPPHKPDEITDDFRKIRRKYAEECCIITSNKLEKGIIDYGKEKG